MFKTTGVRTNHNICMNISKVTSENQVVETREGKNAVRKAQASRRLVRGMGCTSGSTAAAMLLKGEVSGKGVGGKPINNIV